MAEKERILFIRPKNPANASRSGANTVVVSQSNGMINGSTPNGMHKENGSAIKGSQGSSKVPYKVELPKLLPAPVGLINSGVNCFFNASLQGLLACPAFVDFLFNLDRLVPKDNATVDVLDMLGKLAHSVQNSELKKRRIFNAIDILRLVRKASRDAIQANRQEDAHEAMCVLFDMMEKACLRRMGLPVNNRVDNTSESTPIHVLFGGASTTTTKCPGCKHKSSKVESFLQLSLELEANRSSSVNGLLRKMSEVERLDAKNKWECDGCKNKVCAERQTVISKTPPVLIVQLKRFGFSFANGSMKRTKLKTPVSLHGEELVVEKGDGTKVKYDLVAVLVHQGSSVHSGHYFSYVKCARNGHWHEVDDEIVTRIKFERVVNEKEAYMLFYCQRDRKRLNQMIIQHVISPRLSPRALAPVNGHTSVAPLSLPPRVPEPSRMVVPSAQNEKEAIKVLEAKSPETGPKSAPIVSSVRSIRTDKSSSTSLTSGTYATGLSSYASSVYRDPSFLAKRRARIEASIRSHKSAGSIVSSVRRFYRIMEILRFRKSSLSFSQNSSSGFNDGEEEDDEEVVEAEESNEEEEEIAPKRLKVVETSERTEWNGGESTKSIDDEGIFSFDRKQPKKKRFRDAWDKILDKGKAKKVRNVS